MPCNSDYMNPTHKEVRLRHTANIALVLAKKLGASAKVTSRLRRIANDSYASDDFGVTWLCITLTGMKTNNELDAFVYSNPKDKAQRALADWWEEHESADAKRLKTERDAKRTARHREIGLAKLTRDERRALGLLHPHLQNPKVNAPKLAVKKKPATKRVAVKAAIVTKKKG